MFSCVCLVASQISTLKWFCYAWLVTWSIYEFKSRAQLVLLWILYISYGEFRLRHFKWIPEFSFYTFNVLLHEAKFLTFCWINYFRTRILRVWVSPFKLSSTQRKKRCEINYDLRTLRCISISRFTALCWTLADFSVSWSFYTVGRAPWTGNQPFARPPPAHRTTQTQNIRTHTSMSQVEFEPTIPVLERAKTVHALDCAATVIGLTWIYTIKNKSEICKNPKSDAMFGNIILYKRCKKNWERMGKAGGQRQLEIVNLYGFFQGHALQRIVRPV
jgi:hypothetical protein